MAFYELFTIAIFYMLIVVPFLALVGWWLSGALARWWE